ncbi:MAG: SIMPL domain-containing protein [Hymenobacteraceae bacterium]|nr:SIMPL domain-containing protein [Hymenobacteraceae bacterium]
MQYSIIGLLTAALLTTLPGFGQSSTSLDRPNITVRGLGTVTAFPNAAQVTLTVLSNKPALRDAVGETQRVTRGILTLLKQYISDSTTVKTSLITTDKLTNWNSALKKEVSAGFNASQRIIFTLTDLKRMQVFTEEVLKLRIHEIERLSYFNTEGARFMKQAQESAVQDALESTERLAKAGHIRLGKVIYLTTGDSPGSGADESVESEQFQSYGKSMQVRGVGSTGQLITYRASVTMQTGIE